MLESEKYLIALDLDGTLLKDDKSICKSTIFYLRKLEKMGHYIVLCSGRAPRSMKKYYKLLNLHSPMISYNGALVSNPYDPNFKKISFKIDKEFSLAFYNKGKNNGISSSFLENENTIYCDEEDDFLFAFFNRENLSLKRGEISSILDEDTYVYVVKLTHEEREKESLKNLVSSISSKYRLRYWWDCDYAEIHPLEVSKENAINKLKEVLNIDSDRVICFGDADNDLEMLTSFKNSYLMKNGNPKLFDKVKNITKKDNNHNGIKKALKEFFKKNS